MIRNLCILAVATTTVSAQAARYKINGNDKLILAQAVGTRIHNPAESVAQNFFDEAEDQDYSTWVTQLSKACFSDDTVPGKNAVKWYTDLSASKKHYELVREGPTVRSNQKILYFAPSDSNKMTERQVVLVKEHGQWKVFSMR